MKRLLSILLCLVLVAGFLPSVSAASPKIVDQANLLTDQQEQALETKAQALVDEFGMDVVIVTVWSLDGKSAQDYADDYFDYNDYGIGLSHSGVLFLLSMEYRDWAISTCGDAIYALTDYGIEILFESCKDYLRYDQFYEAFDVYLSQLSGFFQAYEDGRPIDGYHDSDVDDYIIYDPDNSGGTVHYRPRPKAGDIARMVFIGLLAGLAIAAIAIGILRAGMNSFKPQTNADAYVPPNGFKMTHQRDVFLYSKVSKTHRESSSSSGSGRSGGGSSTHRSSSGRSHGGRSGKF